MNQSKSTTDKTQSRRSNLVTVRIAGDKVRVDPSSLTWKSHHGTTPRGNEVRSAQTSQIGNSIGIRGGNGGQGVFLTTDEFELMATQKLVDLGYTITPPTQQIAGQ